MAQRKGPYPKGRPLAHARSRPESCKGAEKGLKVRAKRDRAFEAGREKRYDCSRPIVLKNSLSALGPKFLAHMSNVARSALGGTGVRGDFRDEPAKRSMGIPRNNLDAISLWLNFWWSVISEFFNTIDPKRTSLTAASRPDADKG